MNVAFGVLLALHMGFHVWLIWREWGRNERRQPEELRVIGLNRALNQKHRGPWVDLARCAESEVPKKCTIANWTVSPQSDVAIAAGAPERIWLWTEGRN